MAIIQISKLQHRSGNLVDLPQLSDAEFGWATDTKRLFIGKSSPNENIEVLTSYSNVNFSQIIGAEGNLNISGALTGQVLSYDGNNWVNKGSTGGGVINLGDVGNVKIESGAIGYVLQTDGTGNLSWTPKGTLYTTITDLTNDPTGNVITMKVDTTVPYTNGQAVTISSGNILDAGASANVNGHTFYLKLATDYSTTGNVTLYSDLTLLTTANGSGLTSYVANSGIATAVLSTGGAGGAGGATTSILYNNSGIITGDANITFDFTSRIFTVNGNANVGNLNATRVVSTVATGTTPIQVSSTTLVPNLYVARANVVDNSIITAQTTGTFYPTFVSGSTTGNYSHGSNSALSFNVATGTLAATLLTGTLTSAAQPNVTAVGTLTSLVVTGTAAAGNLSTGGTLSVTGNANVGNLGTTGLIIATGNISGANLTGTHYGAATGLTAIPGANVSGTVANATYADSTTTVTTGGSVTTTDLTSGATATAGTITGNWSLSAGSKLNATYADLAECYTADADYGPGTVLEFGGTKEVTLASDATNRVAGVVSTNPAYVMNSLCPGAFVSAVALQGRAPCKVRGIIHKGDMLISGGDGFARTTNTPLMGTIIGKSLEDFNGTSGVIEVAVGRL